MKFLLARVQSGREEEFLDRLLMAGVVEARGWERFSTLSRALREPELVDFYTEIAQSESRHRDLFVDLALEYFPSARVQERIGWWVEQDAQALATIPVRPALH